MSNHVPAGASCPSCDISQPSFKSGLYHADYQRALEDFAILPLLHRLRSCFSDQSNAAWVSFTNQGAEATAVLLIQALTAKLNSKLLATCLKNLRCKSPDLSQTIASLQLAPLTTDLPASFPDIETPQFLYGDRVEWIADRKPTDSGIVIGRFYSFAPHCDRWCWCYLIWLNSDSPSSAWIQADVAWEDALQPAIVAREDSLERME